MSNEQSNSTLENQPDELTVLKQRADKMGIKYSNNISAETLRGRINDHLEGKSPKDEGTKTMSKRADLNARRAEMIKEKTKLVRVRITNNDQRHKGIPGEFHTVGNSLIGTITKYIPYGNGTEDGYHIPQIMLDFLKSKTYVHIAEIRDRNTRKKRVVQSERPKFTIEVLPPLTEAELKELAQRQMATRALED